MGGSLRIFRVAGIDVYVHWSWLLVAFIELRYRTNNYEMPAWNIAEYLALFGIVLLHEFGHALACRSVGGKAEQILLWPLGGVAYVSPPPRPGPLLWSIAAGPLVNVALLPVTIGLWLMSGPLGLPHDPRRFLGMVATINGVLLVFNMLPIYPLDGGQIVQALLWFVMGRTQSLRVVSIFGLAVALGVIVLAVMGMPLLGGDTMWTILLAAFVGWRSWAGLQQAQALSRFLSMPRHEHAACPSCGARPILGEFWGCGRCRTRFDTFAHGAVCPGCGDRYDKTTCIECHASHPYEAWLAPAHPDPAQQEEAAV
jgi:Zn-dependent protease